jgi:competence protein ComEC
MPLAALVALLAALASGVYVGDRMGPAPATGLLVVALAAAVVAGFGRLPAMRLAAALLAAAALGGALCQRAQDGLVHSPVSAAVDARADAVLSGRLVTDPDATRWSARAVLRIDAVVIDDGPRRDGGGRHVLVDATGAAGPRLALLESGDRVELAGWLQPLDDYDRYLARRHVVATLEASELRRVDAGDRLLERTANALRALVFAGLDRLPATERAVTAGFLLGDTRGVPEPVEDQFRAAGLSHLLAVSGANVAFVLALAAPVLRRLTLRGRLVGGLAVVVLFGTMTRWEPSVLRASAMAAATMLALHLGRPTAGVRVLVLAVMVLLVVDPFLLFSVGFLLSCGATAGITILARPIGARLRGPAWVRDALGVTIAAQVGVAPVLLPVFGTVPLAALPANVVALPLAAPITVFGLPAAVAGGLVSEWSPVLARLVQLPTLLLTRAVLTVAATTSRIPVSIDVRAAWALVTVGCVATAIVVRRRARTRERSG